jgi:mRNA-degrading endonuclease RelE of RelBE toxin-antitoxin system
VTSGPANRVKLSRPAEKDVRGLRSVPEWRAIRAALEQELTAVPLPGNLDIKALEGKPPWLRLRVGSYRVLFRPLAPDELELVPGEPRSEKGRRGYFVARVVHRGKLDEAVAQLR